MAQDYRGFQDQVMGDVNKAAMAARNLSDDAGPPQKIRLRTSDMPRFVPPGASVKIQPTVFHKLLPGDLICARVGKDLAVRRYVRHVMDGPSAILLVTHDSARLLEEVEATQMMGLIIEIEYKGMKVEPRKKIGGFQRMIGKMTDFGTSNPLRKMLDTTREFFGLLKRKGTRKRR